MGFQAESAGVRAMNDRIMFFVKFGEETYVRRLFNGRMYFSNAVKFRGIEKENGLKGQGDAFEAILQLKNGYAIMTDPCTGLSISHPDTTVSLGLADTEHIPVFCITCIPANDCEIQENNGKQTITVSDALRNTISEHFPKADTAGVFFQPQRFIDSLAGLGVTCHDRVRYFDFSPKGIIKEMVEYIAQQPGTISKHNHPLFSMCMETNDGERNRLEITERNMKHILFCKDYYFAGENEYRIILPQKRIDAPKEYSIRWGKQKRKLYPIDEFFNGIEL